MARSLKSLEGLCERNYRRRKTIVHGINDRRSEFLEFSEFEFVCNLVLVIWNFQRSVVRTVWDFGFSLPSSQDHNWRTTPAQE